MADPSSKGKLAVLMGGGPAPGVNGVIASVTIEAVNQGLEVLGVKDGFKYLVQGDTSAVRRLTIPDVTPIFNRGGSVLGTSRTNPAKSDADMARVLDCFDKLGVTDLVTIGGDDTAFSGSQVYKRAGGKIKVAHVPKTIDNDLPLPPGTPTFGFETARHLGVQLARNLYEDARTAGRWYLVISMGRAAGHLALGIGKAAAATVTVIAEEFGKKNVSLDHVCDIVVGSVVKRLAGGKGYGLAVLAEGLIESIGEKGLLDALGDDLGKFGNVERDPHGHLRLGEIEFGRMIRYRVTENLAKLGVKITMVDKDLGYELRCADPIPFDAEYTRNLGYGAVKFLMSPAAAAYGAIISYEGGSLKPLKFDDMIDPATRRMRPRLVDVQSELFECAVRYMTRLEASDFSHPDQLARLAAVVKLTPEQFRERFEYLVK